MRGLHFNYTSPDFVAGVYVDRLLGNNANAGTKAAPYETLAYAYENNAEGVPVYVARGQTHRSTRANRQWGNYGLSGVKRELRDWGDSNLPAPVIDTRNYLDGLTWTLLSGNAWETTVTLQDTPILTGVNVSNAYKFSLALDAEVAGTPGGALLTWKVGGANAAANEANVIANAGSWSMDVAGEGEIRAAGGTHTTAHLVVHMPDGSNPNGAALKLQDADDGLQFYGGRHGDLVIIGGASKDGWHSQSLAGVIPTFTAVEVVFVACHGGVGPKNVLGLFKAVGIPSPGVPIGDSHGRTLGGMLHLYTQVDLTGQDITIGQIDVANGTIGVYGHPSGNQGYNKISSPSRATITNCSTGARMDGGPSAGVPFLVDGMYFNGGADMLECDVAFAPNDEPNWLVNGGSHTCTNPASNRATTVYFAGAGTNFTLKDFTINQNFPSTSPLFQARTLFSWIPYYGHGGSPAAPTLTLDNVQDITAIDAGNGKYKAQFYAKASISTHAARVNMVQANGTTLGNMWGSSTDWATYPNSLIIDAAGKTGFGNGTWATFTAAMDGLSRAYTVSAGAKLVDKSGTVLDTAVTELTS